MNMNPSETNSLNRRDFLRGGAALTGLGLGLSLMPRVLRAAPQGGTAVDRLQGFVVTDAHFGWINDTQPSTAEIAKTMANIMRRFPELDVFVDTGDAHHSYATRKDYGEWMDTIQAGCGHLPFMLCAGNHDLASPFPTEDPELNVMRMGSMPCRPFFSMDLKNVHIVVIPQLMDVSMVTREALEWLKLDLALNADKTTIIMSHQALTESTFVGEDTTYRLLANSDQIYDLFERYRNVVGWMHGHNHNYEVVRKGDVLCVSNGRIGGFDPHHDTPLGEKLGGFFFEVTPERFTIRAYSGNEDFFLDTVDGMERLHQSIEKPMSVSAKATPAFSFGSGQSMKGQRWPIWNHIAGAARGKTELILAGSAVPIVNDNENLTYHLQGPRGHQIGAMHSHPDLGKDDDRLDETVEFLDPGIRFNKLDDLDQERALQSPNARGTHSNWRCPAGTRQALELTLKADQAGPEWSIKVEFFGTGRNGFKQIRSPWQKVKPGTDNVRFEFDVPSLDQIPMSTIYHDPEQDEVIYVAVEAWLRHLNTPVILTRMAMAGSDAVEMTRDASVTLGGKTHAHAGSLRPGQIARFDLPALKEGRQVAEIGAKGSGVVTWLVRQTGPLCQVRNAAVADHGDRIEVGPLRHFFSVNEEVIFAPLTRATTPWVHRMRHVNRAIIHPWDEQKRAMEIDMIETTGYAVVELRDIPKPKRVRNSDDFTWEDGRLEIGVRQNRTLVIQT